MKVADKCCSVERRTNADVQAIDLSARWRNYSPLQVGLPVSPSSTIAWFLSIVVFLFYFALGCRQSPNIDQTNATQPNLSTRFVGFTPKSSFLPIMAHLQNMTWWQPDWLQSLPSTGWMVMSRPPDSPTHFFTC